MSMTVTDASACVIAAVDSGDHYHGTRVALKHDKDSVANRAGNVVTL